MATLSSIADLSVSLRIPMTVMVLVCRVIKGCTCQIVNAWSMGRGERHRTWHFWVKAVGAVILAVQQAKRVSAELIKGMGMVVAVVMVVE